MLPDAGILAAAFTAKSALDGFGHKLAGGNRADGWRNSCRCQAPPPSWPGPGGRSFAPKSHWSGCRMSHCGVSLLRCRIRCQLPKRLPLSKEVGLHERIGTLRIAQLQNGKDGAMLCVRLRHSVWNRDAPLPVKPEHFSQIVSGPG
jgi:hypothetical protein